MSEKAAIPTTEKIDLLRLLSQGKCLVAGEWRGFLPESIKYTDGKGAKAQFNRILHTIECGDGQRIESIKVSQSVPDGTDVNTVQVPFTKGQRVVVVVGEIKKDKGNVTVRATEIHLLA